MQKSATTKPSRPHVNLLKGMYVVTIEVAITRWDNSNSVGIGRIEYAETTTGTSCEQQYYG